jgi:hypothetical protein
MGKSELRVVLFARTDTISLQYFFSLFIIATVYFYVVLSALRD